jgi:hypothetical protein
MIPSTYWVTVGLKEKDSFLNFGKVIATLYQRINITVVEPRFLMSRSPNANIEIYGDFEGLM